MIAKSSLKRISLGGVLMFVFMGLSVSNVSAHVTVKPGEVETSTYQVFTVNVPNEKDIPTTSVRVVMADGVSGVTPTQKAGWSVSAVEADDAVREITWEGGEITKGLRDEFSFSAKTPNDAGSLKWKAYQTYSDGTVVSWDQEESHGDAHGEGEENTGPLSVTSVIAASTDGVSGENSEVAAAKADAQRALYVAIAAAVAALVALLFATRKRRS